MPQEEEKNEMSCEDPLLDEMLMKAERLRMAMLVATNPIPDSIETRHGDNMTECSSVGHSTVFSKVLRTDHAIAKTKTADADAPASTASFRDNHSRRGLLGVTTEEEEEKTVDEEDVAVATPAVGQRKMDEEVEDTSADEVDEEDDNNCSPVALSAPNLDVDASSVVAIQFASKWQGMAAKTRTIARMGDVDFSPVADYSSRSVNTVKWEKVTLAKEHDDDYVPMKDYSPTAKATRSSLAAAPSVGMYGLGPFGTYRMQRPLRKNRRRRVLWVGTFVVAIGFSFWLQVAPQVPAVASPQRDEMCLKELDFEQFMIEANRALQLQKLTVSRDQQPSPCHHLPRLLAPLCDRTMWAASPQEKRQMVEEFLLYSLL